MTTLAYSDLKLLDEMLCDYMLIAKINTCEELERHSYLTGCIMRRLREAWKSGEMPVITMRWAIYFNEEQIDVSGLRMCPTAEGDTAVVGIIPKRKTDG